MFKKPIFWIFLLALALRFWHISQVPVCMNWDEASFLYNAYSISETSRDEYGKFLPLQFKSVGDYKFPGFIYMLTPVVKVFGLNTFAVRFLPSLLGSLTILILYLIAKRLFKNKKVALLSALFLAISPWHLQFTRAGADVGVETFFTLLGIYLTLRALENKKRSYIPAGVSFAVAIYTYYTARVFIPLFALISLVTFKKLAIRKSIFKDIFVFLLILAPALYLTFGSGQGEKLSKTTVLGASRSTEYVENLAQKDSSGQLSLYHNDLYEKVLGIADHYLAHFSPEFLFVRGAEFDLRQQIYGMGVVYLYELPLLMLGISFLLKKRDRESKFLMLWILISPIPAAITRDPVHARRGFNMVYPLVITSAIGANIFWGKIKKRSAFIKLIPIGVAMFFVSFYLASYYVFTPLRVSKGPGGFNCGYRELVEYISPIKNNYKKVVVDTAYQGAYLYFLIYEKYPPQNYQPQANLVQANKDSLGESGGYDNYEFRPIYWPDDRGKKGYLFAGTPESIPLKDLDQKVKLLKTIYFDNGEVAFQVVEVYNSP